MKKQVTEKVRAANRLNSQSSTGPKTAQGQATASLNSLRHGILARKVVLNGEIEQREYEGLWKKWNAQFRPQGLEEEFLVEEIINTLWKLGLTEALETKELSQRQNASDSVDGLFQGDLSLPLNSWAIPLRGGWDCERIFVHATAGKDRSDSSGSHGAVPLEGRLLNARHSNNEHKTDHLEVQAVLGSTLQNLTRYRSTLKRDLYKALETLHNLQAERCETKDQQQAT